MNKKTRPIDVAYRDPPQNERHTQTESNGVEKDILCNWKRE